MTRRRIAGGQVAVAVLLGLTGLVVAGVLPLLTERSSEPRDIVVVARGMAFYLADGSQPNPTIRVEVGETVRLVLRNEQSGVTHDFVVDAWDLATARLDGHSSDTVVFRVPDRIGRYDYECGPHGALMRGTIEVVGPLAARGESPASHRDR